jgi:hypothetical protein
MILLPCFSLKNGEAGEWSIAFERIFPAIEKIVIFAQFLDKNNSYLNK